MGYIRHHAIVVTSIDENIETLHARAVAIFGNCVSPIIDSETNGYRSFLVAPDGSKEGRDLSIEGDRRREEFTSWLTEQVKAAPWNGPDWIEVEYGAEGDRPSLISSDSSRIASRAQDESN